MTGAVRTLTHFGGAPLKELAHRFGTPLYVYDLERLRRDFSRFSGAFRNLGFVAYSLKANPNRWLLRTLADLGAGADAVSGGEVLQALSAGIPAEKIVFAGPAKTSEELDLAAGHRIFAIHVENEGEARYLAEHWPGTRVGLRVNPAIDPGTHPKIATGLPESRFGLPLAEVPRIVHTFSSKLQIRGLHVHIGSQIRDPRAYLAALDRVLPLLDLLPEAEYLDLGGGFGVDYEKDEDPWVREILEALRPRVEALGVQVLLEPGRSVVARCGLLLARVLYVKPVGTRTYALLDAGMTDLVRPALYGVRHRVQVVTEEDRPLRTYTLAGPVCENTDVFAEDLSLPELRPGDLVVFRDAGAYGFSMACNYNLRARPAEVAVEQGRAALIRPREPVGGFLMGEPTRLEFIPLKP